MNRSSRGIMRFLSSLLLLSFLPASRAQVTYPTRRITNTCGVSGSSFTSTARVAALAVSNTGDVHALVEGQNLLRRFNSSGAPGYSVTTLVAPSDVAVTASGDAWVVSRSGNGLQRITFAGTVGATYGATVAGTDPVAVAAITAGGGGIADAWIVNGSARQVRRVAFTGSVAFSQNLAGTPVDVAVLPTGECWVAMRAPNQLQRFAASGVAGPVIALAGTPVAVDVDATGNVAVATAGANELRSYGPNANLRFSVALPAAPGGVAVDPSGNACVTLPASGELRRCSVNTGALLCSVALPYQPAALDVAPGNGDVWVASEPAPNPTPQISALTPGDALAGGAAFTLTVDGSGLVAGSVVRWNGADLATTLVSATRLTASVAAARIATTGTADVAVFTPAPGGGTSNHVAFRIGRARASFAAYGTGCAGSAGVPLLAQTGAPLLGTSYRLDLSAARAQSAAVVFLGASRTAWLGLPLPLSLTAAGASGCAVLAAGDLQVALTTSAAGTATLMLPVPADASLLAQHLYQQVLVVDAAANPLHLVATRGIDALLGDL